jgi:hypothetical protein
MFVKYEQRHFSLIISKSGQITKKIIWGIKYVIYFLPLLYEKFLVLLGRTLAIYTGVVGRSGCTCLCKVLAITVRLKNK